jgi:hypothetical protein
MALAITIVTRDANHCVAVFGGTFIQIWRLATTYDAACRVRSAARALGTRRSGPLSSFIIIEAACQVPDSASRAVLAFVLKDLGPRCIASAFTYEGDGFRAAAVRAVLTGMTLINPPAMPHLVFQKVSDAGLWVRRIHAEAGDPAADSLPDAITQLRRELASTPEPIDRKK